MSDVEESLKKVDDKIAEISILEEKNKKNMEKIKLWKEGNVFEGLHKGFSLIDEVEFYLDKIDKIVDK